MIVNLQFGLLVLIVSGISTFFAAEWSEWMDITPCSSKPCECDPPDKTRCPSNSNGKKAQIRRCIREKGEIDSCKGGGPFRLVTDCNNKNVCPGWSEWSDWSECNCSTNQRKRTMICNNPAPIHPEVLCVKFDSLGGTIQEQSSQCQCSADQYTTTSTTPTATSTDPPETTVLPWCCEMFKVDDDDDDKAAAGGDYGDMVDGLKVDDDDDDEAIAGDDFGDYGPSLPICEPKETDDYIYYDSICIKCLKENGYNCTESKSTDDNPNNSIFP